MVAFLTGQTLTFSQPNVQVDAVSAPGTYRFELIVVDNRNIASAPASILVRVADRGVPEAHPTQGI